MRKIINTDPALAALQTDVTALKHDLADLLSHIKIGANGGAQVAASQIEESTQTLYRNAAAGAERSLKALGHQIEEQPLMAWLILLGVGFIGGRLLTR